MASVKTITATVNGQSVALTLNNTTGKYEATLTAPSASSFNQTGGYYDVQIDVEDTAGNTASVNSTHSTLGNSLKLYVKEEVKPKILILAPTTGARVTSSTPEIKFKVTDNNNGQSVGYSGINKSSLVMKVSGKKINVSDVTWTDTAGGYIGTYTPTQALSDGENEIVIDINDNDGNAAQQGWSQYYIDTIAPSLVITSPSTDNYITNFAQFTVSGITDDATSKPVYVSVKLNQVEVGGVTVGNDGTFSIELTLVEGTNRIDVVATDSAGKSVCVTRNIILDTEAPTIKSVQIKANGAVASSSNKALAGKTYTIEVEVE